MSEHLNLREYLMQLVAGECLFSHTPQRVQNSITVMRVAELSLKQNAHYGPQMKMTFVEFYPIHICYEGTAQRR